MNAAWHEQHPMPKAASLEQKIRWHEEHMKACACVSPPGAILVELERRDRRANRKKGPPRR